MSSEVVILFDQIHLLPKHDGWDSFSSDQFEKVLREKKFKVLALPLKLLENSRWAQMIIDLQRENPKIQIVGLLSQGQRMIPCAQTFHQLTFARMAQLESLENEVYGALENVREKEQNQELEQLVRSLNERLKNLYQELEDRVQKRQNALLESKKKTYLAQTRWELLLQATMAVHSSRAASEIETGLLEVLQSSLSVDLIRVIYKPYDDQFRLQTQNHKEMSLLQCPLFDDRDQVGSLFFIRYSKKPFSKEESDFIVRLSEIVSLALKRVAKNNESLMLKEQWQVTFNAISDPVALIDKSYRILQSNSAFDQMINRGNPRGQFCYEKLFKRDSPCLGCKMGEKFRLDFGRQKATSFEVSSQKVPLERGQEELFFHVYHDVTEELRMERKILESARLAEIGLIGSSIAHELNNPLGGILSYVQLLKMDLSAEHPLQPDLQEMENGVRRCQEIIQNLLNFTRNPVSDEEVELDLKDVLLRALKIVELQTKSRGIEVKLNWQSGPRNFIAHMNLLSQALRNLLQQSIDSLMQKMKDHKSFKPVIEIYLESSEKDYEISILDNGLGLDSLPSLNFSIASQIIHDYGGTLEVSSHPQKMRRAKITLPRPVL
ncbi:MAG: histidine kinase dimerization/phospho-acceptor domain-containing protein [Pseudobdellovibrionaceae bacterium]